MILFKCFNFHRTHKSNIENHLHANQRKDPKIGQKFGFCLHKNESHFYVYSDVHRQFRQLFYYRFGTRFIWATVSHYVVSLTAPQMFQMLFNPISDQIFRFPFDVNEPVGYTLAIASQFIISVNLCLADVCVLIVLIVPCLVLISTTDDIKYGLDVLNTSARANESDFKVTQQFNQIVQFHSKVKRWREQIFLLFLHLLPNEGNEATIFCL